MNIYERSFWIEVIFLSLSTIFASGVCKNSMISAYTSMILGRTIFIVVFIIRYYSVKPSASTVMAGGSHWWGNKC